MCCDNTVIFTVNVVIFSVFYQLQQVFGQLLESKLQYFEPEKFWKVFKLWGQVVNIREQQDAFDFFTALMDQADEYTKVKKKSEFSFSEFILYMNFLLSLL